MKKYLLSYMAPPAAIATMMQAMTPEISKQHNDSWEEWMTKHKDAVVDQGSMLGKNMRVSSTGATAVANDMTGYSVIQAESAEATTQMVMDNPMLQMTEAYIEVTEMMPMSGN